MAAGLGTLVENLDKSSCSNMSSFYKGQKLDLLLRKGVYPYDYINSITKLDETSLPPIEEFYSKLNKTHISEEDYKHAQNIWKKFEIKNMKEYHNLYLKSDVILLADVFENFRNVCMKNYKLDPAW